MLLFTFVVLSVALASNIVKEFKPADSNNFALDSQWYTQGDVGNWPDQLQKDKSQLSWFLGNDDGQRFRQLATSNNTVKALNKVWWDEKHPENPTAGVTFYYSDYLTKYIDDVDALKTIAARYGPKMAQFCKERLGQYVGDGLCGALTAAAQKAVGAVEGREITVMKINDGKIVWQADEIRQGDLVLTPEHVQLVDTGNI